MEGRVLIKDLHEYTDKEVLVYGWVDIRRDHGKLIFLDIRDRTGKVQAVALPNNGDVVEKADTVRPEYVISVKAKVNKRPEKMVNANEQNGDIELELLELESIAPAHELPFEKDADINIDTRFDYRPFTLRSERDQHIFKVQAAIAQAYRWSLIQQGFLEFQSPALVREDAEGGGAAFKLEYFYDQDAYLATSPQLYKQIMVGAFERAFTVAKIFRAEKSATTRHLSEITQMDFEMGFINDERDVLAVLEQTVRDTINAVVESHKDSFDALGVEPPRLGKKFPILTLQEVFDIVGGEGDDLDPEHERAICEWSKKEHDCDFVFVTRFPTDARAFYTMSENESSTLSRGFDLLFKGLEINSGAQRIHDYDTLVTRIKDRGLDPEKFDFYLQGFKYGMPPHGGCSTGLERFTARMLDLANVKEASAFPRDLNRIDTLLRNEEE